MIKFDHFAERGPLRRVRQALNDMREEIKSLRIANGIGYTVKRTAIGQVLQVRAAKGVAAPEGITLQRFRVERIETDATLICIKVNADNTDLSTTEYLVETPYCVRIANQDSLPTGAVVASITNTGYQDRTFNVTKTVGGTTKTFSLTQKVFPAYTAPPTSTGSYIVAAKDIEGHGPTVDIQGTTYNVEWLDLNVDGRHWVYDDQTVEVCVNGVTKYMMLPGSGTAS